ncbi:MAG: hypothetical protein U0936_04800 [Planctomycetaceae bacterium]
MSPAHAGRLTKHIDAQFLLKLWLETAEKLQGLHRSAGTPESFLPSECSISSRESRANKVRAHGGAT